MRFLMCLARWSAAPRVALIGSVGDGREDHGLHSVRGITRPGGDAELLDTKALHSGLQPALGEGWRADADAFRKAHFRRGQRMRRVEAKAHWNCH